MAKEYRFEISSRAYLFLALFIISIAVTAVSLSFNSIQFAVSGDEGYYLKYSTAIANNGLGGFADLFKEYIATPRYWVFPNPLRVGFIIISSLWIKLFGFGYFNLACLSLFSYCLLLCVSFYYTRKYFGDRLALLFLLLISFSPLLMAVARRALMDSTANLFSVLSMWAFYDLQSNRSKSKLYLFTADYALANLVKETSVLLSFIFFAYLLWQKFIFKRKVYFIDYLLSSIIPFFLVGVVYAGLGVLPYLAQTAKIIITSPKTNPYALDFGSGPWFRYLIDYMLISPFVMLLAIGFIFHWLADKSVIPVKVGIQTTGFPIKTFGNDEQRTGDQTIPYFMIIFVSLIFIYEFFTKNVRYVILLDYPIRLFALFMLAKICERLSPRRGYFLLSILVIAIASFDYVNF